MLPYNMMRTLLIIDSRQMFTSMDKGALWWAALHQMQKPIIFRKKPRDNFWLGEWPAAALSLFEDDYEG